MRICKEWKSGQWNAKFSLRLIYFDAQLFSHAEMILSFSCMTLRTSDLHLFHPMIKLSSAKPDNNFVIGWNKCKTEFWKRTKWFKSSTVPTPGWKSLIGFTPAELIRGDKK